MASKSLHKARTRLETFARQYVILNCNGTQAAIAAGFSKKTADRQASRMLRNVKVKGLIASLLAAQQKKQDISVERVLQQIALHAFFDPRTLTNPDGSYKKLHEMDAGTAACIAGLEVDGTTIKKVRFSDGKRALEMLARYHKLFAEDRTPIDLGVKVIVLDMPRPMRQVGSGAAALPPSNGHKPPHDD